MRIPALVLHARSIARIASILTAATIALLSVMPSETSVSSGLGDKIEHFAAYGTLAIVALAGWRGHRRVAWILAACLALGIGLELVQTFVPGRKGHILDVAANTLGVALGATVVLALTGLARRLRGSPRRLAQFDDPAESRSGTR